MMTQAVETAEPALGVHRPASAQIGSGLRMGELPRASSNALAWTRRSEMLGKPKKQASAQTPPWNALGLAQSERIVAGS